MGEKILFTEKQFSFLRADKETDNFPANYRCCDNTFLAYYVRVIRRLNGAFNEMARHGGGLQG